MLKYCKKPGCRQLTKTKYCQDHKHLEGSERAKTHRVYDDKRGTPAQRGYDKQWRKARRIYMRNHYFCEICGKEKAVICHHKKSIEEHPELRLRLDNLQAVCLGCHNELHKGVPPSLSGNYSFNLPNLQPLSGSERCSNKKREL